MKRRSEENGKKNMENDDDDVMKSDRKKKISSSSMKRSGSVQQLMSMMGPTQLQKLENRTHPESRYFLSTAAYLIVMWIVGIASLCLIPSCETKISDISEIIWDVATFQRHPISAQDNVGSTIATLLCMIPIFVFDFSICRPFLPNAGSRWYLIHAVGNTFVCLLAVQDFWWIGT